ncbi:MAG TPA: hypothetical protein VM012_13140 [Flavitalea sp.]|nr:hypothetical protein [Flavitalea sp.]
MRTLGRIKKVNIADDLCQHWELADMSGASSIELVMEPVTNIRIFPDLALFRDSGVVENVRNRIRLGRWRLNETVKPVELLLIFPENIIKTYRIRKITSTSLQLATRGSKEWLFLTLTSDGKVHEQSMNDPFHPANNSWRIKPGKPESHEEIRQRVKKCVWFYMLYFRDCIKRQKDVISFLGLPSIFRWYSGGIGLPDREKIDNSWIICFYNKRQALEGYDLLRKLIIQHEFTWPTNTPSWVHQTFEVLEQMWLKL